MKSSIEWLDNNLKSLISEDGAIYDFKLNVLELLDQAKQMHKQEIKNAFRNGIIEHDSDYSSEQYYKNTYEKE